MTLDPSESRDCSQPGLLLQPSFLFDLIQRLRISRHTAVGNENPTQVKEDGASGECCSSADIDARSPLVFWQPPQVAELINKLLNTPQDDLISTLQGIDSWKWQRSDLNAWIKVLNKFDAILEEIIREYDIDKLQINDFAPKTKTLLSEILRFERLLLENSTNRKMYNSYDVRSQPLSIMKPSTHLLPSDSIAYSLRRT